MNRTYLMRSASAAALLTLCLALPSSRAAQPTRADARIIAPTISLSCLIGCK